MTMGPMAELLNQPKLTLPRSIGPQKALKPWAVVLLTTGWSDLGLLLFSAYHMPTES